MIKEMLAVVLSVIFMSVPSNAFARDRYRVILRVADSPYSFSEAEARELFGEAKDFISSRLGITLNLSRVVHTTNLYSVQLSDREDSLLRWSRYYNNHSPRRPRKTIVVVMTGPLLNGGDRYIAGYSSGTCSAGRRLSVVVINGQMYNQFGALRWYHSLTSLVHELGHALGASHAVDQTLMNENALALVNGTIIPEFSTSSFNAIRYCQHLPF